ncbi:MAG: hypothetical protein AB7O66_18915 [Limisphaerales bacterium]
MSRFLGMLLMLTTGSVLVELVASRSLPPAGTAAFLGFVFAGIGFLLGVLATERQWLWALFGCASIIAVQFLTGRVPLAVPSVEDPKTWILLVVPPLALILGAVLGARALVWRSQARIKPEHDE